MGIPFYFFRICQKYKGEGIVYESISVGPDVLYFDYNSLIHPCVHGYLNGLSTDNELDYTVIEEEIIDVVIEYTEYIISVINPQQKVVIAIDGVAPRAKMNQQRERRYKKSFLDNNDTHLFDTNMITPGTPFMKRLNLRLLSHAWKFTSIKDHQLIITDSSEVGEGEHKIMNMIREGPPNLNHIIYGLDGDLIMLSLICDQKIVLFRDDQIKNTKIFLDIQKLKTSIISHIKSSLDVNLIDVSQLNSKQLLMDYILICFLLGNDFIPAFANLSILSNGIEILETVYKSIIHKECSFLTILGKNDVYSLNLTVFFHFINGLKDQLEKYKHGERRVGCQLVDDPILYRPGQVEQSNEDQKLVLWNSNWVGQISEAMMSIVNTNMFTHSKELYNLYYSLNDDTTNEWINGLEWILSYYQGHSHQNWTWFYPYQNTPHIEDIIEDINMYQGKIKLTKFEKTEPFTPAQQLLMVLPKKSLQLFSNSSDCSLKNLAKLAESEIFCNFFPPYLVLDGINKRYIWQCKPIGLSEFDEEIVRLKIK